MENRLLDFRQFLTLEGQLNLLGQGLRDEHMVALCAFINAHPQVKSVNLNADTSSQSNRLTESGCKILAADLATNKTCVALHLNNNDLGNQGIRYLAQLKQLTLLDLAATGIDEHGIFYLRNLKRLVSLDVSDNLFGSIGIQAIVAHLRQLRILYVKNCDLTAEDAKALATMPNLIILVINDNKLGDAGAHYISHMKKLCFLDARRNQFSKAGEDIIHNMHFSSLDASEKSDLQFVIKEQTSSKAASLGELVLEKINNQTDIKRPSVSKKS
jgi:hypothetical protein